MRKWKNNNIEIEEIPYNADLHAFEVYKDAQKLGVIYPDSVEAMEEIAERLDAGEDPVSGGREDGLGNLCTLSGWGAESLAREIRNADTWDMEKLAELCELAGMSEAWEQADGETFERVAFEAAEKLGVEI